MKILSRCLWLCGVGMVLALPVAARAVGGGDLERGREVYRQFCRACHGDAGDGKGPAAELLNTPPRDFQRAVFKFRSTPSGHLPTREDLERTIAFGIPKTAMPSWKSLPTRDIRAVADFIRSFSPRWVSEPPVSAVPLPKTPGDIASQAAVLRGEEAYRAAGCWECHGGPAGKGAEGGAYPWGEGPKAAELRDDQGRPSSAYDLRGDYFKGGSRPEDIFRTLTTGMDGTPMPSYADSLSERQRWDLVAYLISLGR
ncbi:MAG: cytochrome c [Nitrospirae bacterium]|nr:cytochrome c [Nitrospirota bacterium]